MEAVTDVEVIVASNFVGVGWVARHYKVSRMTVYRAIKDRTVPAIRTRDGVFLIDARRLPTTIGR